MGRARWKSQSTIINDKIRALYLIDDSGIAYVMHCNTSKAKAKMY